MSAGVFGAGLVMAVILYGLQDIAHSTWDRWQAWRRGETLL